MVNTQTMSTGPYAVECTDALGGLVGMWYATDFAGMIDVYRAAKDAHPSDGYAWEFANLDVAQDGYDGLTADEVATLKLIVGGR